MAGGVFLEGDGAEPAGLHRVAGVVEIDAVGAAGAQGFRKVHENSAGIALVFQGGVAEQNLIDVEGGVQIELDARGVLQHPEADGDLAAEEFLFRVDANVQVVEEQIVVGAIRSVGAAQDIGAGRRGLGRERGDHK